MTEEEWLSSDDPAELQKHSFNISSLRKHRLVYCGICRLVWEQLTHPASRQSVEQSELYADGRIDHKEVDLARRNSLPAKIGMDHSQAASAASLVSRNTGYMDLRYARIALQNSLLEAGHTIAEAAQIQKKLFADLFRDIFGNPFHPMTLDPRWLSSTVLDLASTIYDERVFERMPILADALMDAGCDSEEIIKHCQGPGPHARGCWVADLLLAKG